MGGGSGNADDCVCGVVHRESTALKANKTRWRKRPQPYKKTKVGARHTSSGYRKIVRKWLKQAGLWWNKGYPGHDKGNKTVRGSGRRSKYDRSKHWLR